MDKELIIIPCKLVIENMESKEDIISCLDSFLSSNKSSDNYTMNDNGTNNKLSISFSNSKIAYGFLKEITYKKYNEESYEKMKAQLVFAQKDNEYRRSQSEKASIVSKESISQRNKTTKNKTLQSEKYFTNKTPIRITNPYIDPQKKLFMDYQTNKQMWVSKKPFFNSVNGRVLAQKEEFGTYVQRAPVNYAVVNYNHRDENKDKWIKKNGFIFKKVLPDYIC